MHHHSQCYHLEQVKFQEDAKEQLIILRDAKLLMVKKNVQMKQKKF